MTRLIISPRHLGENFSFTQGAYGRGTTGISVQILHCGACKSPFNSDIFLCHLMRDPTGGSCFKRNFQLSCPNCVRLAYYFSAWRCTQSYGISPSHRRLSARSCMYHKYNPPPFSPKSICEYHKQNQEYIGFSFATHVIACTRSKDAHFSDCSLRQQPPPRRQSAGFSVPHCTSLFSTRRCPTTRRHESFFCCAFQIMDPQFIPSFLLTCHSPDFTFLSTYYDRIYCPYYTSFILTLALNRLSFK